MSNYKAPSYREDSFNCPHCGALAHQSWSKLYADTEDEDEYEDVKEYEISICFSCGKVGLWAGYAVRKLVYPELAIGNIPDPNQDLDEDIRSDFIEARNIIYISPRGATAILRLCLQKLCVQLGQKGKNINDDIAALVKAGLNPKIRQALDIIRVIGNNAVHPGEIDLKDDSQTALTLLNLINLIADRMISEPKQVQSIYDSLPEGAKQAIEKRDSK